MARAASCSYTSRKITCERFKQVQEKPDLLAEDAELVGELLEEEGEELLVLRLRQVVLPLGHVPGGGVRRHHVVGEHLEEGHELFM